MVIVLIIFMILDEYHLALEMKTKQKVIRFAVVIRILFDEHVLCAALVDVFLTDEDPF